MDQTTFYTYSIIQLSTGKLYYGSKYAKNSSIEELGKTYFSSSKSIKKLIEDNGIDDFQFKVRKIFNCPLKCQKFEQKVIRYLLRNYKEFTLNKGAPGAYINDIGPNKNRIVVHNKLLKKQKILNKNKLSNYINQGWELGTLIGTKKLVIVHNINLKINKKILKEDLNDYISQGWVEGYSNKAKEKYKQSRINYWSRIPCKERLINSIFKTNNPSKIGQKKGSFYHNPKTQEQIRSADENKINELLLQGWVKGQNQKTKEKHKQRAKNNPSIFKTNNPMLNPEVKEKARQTITEQYKNGRESINKGKVGELNPNYGKKQSEYQKKSASDSNKKNYIITSPEGEIFKVRGITAFLKSKGLTSYSINNNELKIVKGWKGIIL